MVSSRLQKSLQISLHEKILSKEFNEKFGKQLYNNNHRLTAQEKMSPANMRLAPLHCTASNKTFATGAYKLIFF